MAAFASLTIVVSIQKASIHTERTLSVPLVDTRGHGGMATMDPAGSAVLDHLFSSGAGHSAGAMDTS